MESGLDHVTDTVLRLESPGMSSLYNSNFHGTKRKLSALEVIETHGRTSLSLGLGHSPSSSGNSSKSSAAICALSSPKEGEEDSPFDPFPSFNLHLGNESTVHGKKFVLPTSKASTVPDLPMPSSSGNSWKSSSTICTLSSAKEAERDSLFDPGPIFKLRLGNESTVHGTKFVIHESKASAFPGIPISSSSSNLNKISENICTLSSSKEAKDDSLYDPGRSFKHCLSGKSTPFMLDLNLSFSTGPSDSGLTNTAMDSQNMVGSESTPVKHLPFQDNPDLPLPCQASHQPLRTSNIKICQFLGCGKGARGASGFCISHGGGRRCKKDGCRKGAEGRTIFCKAHGGGRRCEHLGCTKSAEGRTEYCIAHGGGRRCGEFGCTRAARGKSSLCIRHGGGKRCQKEDCTKSAEGYSGLCISHGGGRRCQFPECTKGAQGSTMYCKAHGGGKRCTFTGCSKGAEGSTLFCKGHGGGKRCAHPGGCTKSVHGGTQFCVAHGGGKRCSAPECTKSARGRTDFCVRHGGGKRCQSEGCGKSAQGSTDYCKAHGGGRRCSWGQVGHLLGYEEHCDRFARGKDGLCTGHSGLVQDVQVHGAEVLAPIPGGGASGKAKTVLAGEGWSCIDTEFARATDLLQAKPVSLPEGRVRGGSLMVMLASTTVMPANLFSDRGDTSKHGE